MGGLTEWLLVLFLLIVGIAVILKGEKIIAKRDKSLSEEEKYNKWLDELFP